MKFLLIAGCMLTVLCVNAQANNSEEKVEQNGLNNAIPANSNTNMPATNYQVPSQKADAKKKEEFKAAEEDMESETMQSTPAKDSQAMKTLQMNNSFQTNQYNSTHQYSRRSATIQEQSAMDQSVKFFQAASPESFEANYYHWLAGHYDTSRVRSLEKAQELQPENVEVLKQVAMLNIVEDETAELNSTLVKLDSAGYFTSGQLTYATAMINSCQPNSTLVLHGFDDFLAANYVSNPNNVNLVSLDLLQSESYRDVAAESIAVPQAKNVDIAFFDQLCKANATKNLNLSMTIPSAYFAGMKDKLYVQGLTFVYSDQPLSTFSKNTELWKETSSRGIIGELADDKYKAWLANYRAFLVALRQQSGEYPGKPDHENIDDNIDTIDRLLGIKPKTGK